MIKRSNLFQLAHKDRVECICSVCDRMRIALVRDVSNGWMICGPCVPFVLAAERALAAMPKAKVAK